MSGKVLIADPNLDSCTHLEGILRKQNYEVDKVDNGNLVLTKVCEFQPHILILSVMMPGIKGYDICSAIKSHPDLQGTAILLTFSENEPFDYQKARNCGATRFLPKSVDPSLLVSILNFICLDSSLIKYAQTLSDNYMVHVADNKDGFDSEDDLPEIDMSVEIEPLDYIDEGDMDEGEIDTIEVVDAKEVIYQFEEEIKEIVEVEPIEVNVVVEIEEIEPIEVKEVIEESSLKLNIHTQDKEIELPGLELPRPTTAKLKTAQLSNNLGEVFEPPIVGDQFEYHTEDLEDPLQVKHQLNSIACRECGASVLKQDVFCVECGAAVDETAVRVPEDLSCGTCGQMVSLGDIFCLNCGTVQ